MFQAGDLLVYGTTGVCRVLSIDRRQERVGSTRQERLYYQLKPIYQGGLIYTPVDNDKVSMRPIISRQEAEDLISEIPTLHPAACRASTTQALTQQYQASLRQHNCRSLVELAMSIHAKRRQAESRTAASAWWTSAISSRRSSFCSANWPPRWKFPTRQSSPISQTGSPPSIPDLRNNTKNHTEQKRGLAFSEAPETVD